MWKIIRILMTEDVISYLTVNSFYFSTRADNNLGISLHFSIFSHSVDTFFWEFKVFRHLCVYMLAVYITVKFIESII